MRKLHAWRLNHSFQELLDLLSLLSPLALCSACLPAIASTIHWDAASERWQHPSGLKSESVSGDSTSDSQLLMSLHGIVIQQGEEQGIGGVLLENGPVNSLKQWSRSNISIKVRLLSSLNHSHSYEKLA